MLNKTTDKIKPYWLRLFNSKKALAGYNNSILANELGISLKALNNKIHYNSFFRPNELKFIKENFNLTDQEFITIAIKQEEE